MSEETTTIEINGVKLEVDLRNATRVETLRVGTRVKVLKKNYSSYAVLHGVIIGFEPFKKLPTIIVAAASVEYDKAKIEFIYYNSESVDIEIVVALDNDTSALDKNDFLEQVDREITKKSAEIKEMKLRKEFFLKQFECYWSDVNLSCTADEL